MRKLFYILPGLILILSNNCFAKKVSTYKKISFCKSRSCLGQSAPTAEEHDAQTFLTDEITADITYKAQSPLDTASQYFVINNRSTKQTRAPPLRS